MIRQLRIASIFFLRLAASKRCGMRFHHFIITFASPNFVQSKSVESRVIPSGRSMPDVIPKGRNRGIRTMI